MKTVAIVGASPYLNSGEYASEIDSKDIVVRINAGYKVSTLHPELVGKRTDVIYATATYIEKYLSNDLIPKAKYKNSKLFRVLETETYKPNTGLIAVLDYAMKGYDVYCFGFDFYSIANGGIIPEHTYFRNKDFKPKQAENKDVYISGYSNNSTKLLHHVGGISDVKNMLRYQKNFNIIFDKTMNQIINTNIDNGNITDY